MNIYGSRGVLSKSCSENMQQIYRRTPMPKCGINKNALPIYRRTRMPKCDFEIFIEITLGHSCSLVNLLHIFRTPFTKNTSGWLLLYINVNKEVHYIRLEINI